MRAVTINTIFLAKLILQAVLTDAQCSGTPDPCPTQKNSDSCIRIDGCAWINSFPFVNTCWGKPTPCDEFSTESMCENQGCDWYEESPLPTPSPTELPATSPTVTNNEEACKTGADGSYTCYICEDTGAFCLTIRCKSFEKSDESDCACSAEFNELKCGCEFCGYGDYTPRIDCTNIDPDLIVECDELKPTISPLATTEPLTPSPEPKPSTTAPITTEPLTPSPDSTEPLSIPPDVYDKKQLDKCINIDGFLVCYFCYEDDNCAIIYCSPGYEDEFDCICEVELYQSQCQECYFCGYGDWTVGGDCSNVPNGLKFDCTTP